MDIVIPLSPWSRNNNMDLRYALRSFAKFMDHTAVFIVGHKPDWITNVIHLPFRDDPQPAFRESNIFMKVKYYLEHGGSEKFIFANDDHFLLKEFNPEAPYPHKGTLKECLDSRRADDPYRHTIQNTINLIGAQKHNFDMHCPIVMDSNVIEFQFGDHIKWKTKYGFLFKTLYVNGLFRGYPTVDFKINDPMKEDIQTIPTVFKTLPFFSTSDMAFDDKMAGLMEMLYPDKSRYEKR